MKIASLVCGVVGLCCAMLVSCTIGVILGILAIVFAIAPYMDSEEDVKLSAMNDFELIGLITGIITTLCSCVGFVL